MQQKRKRQMCSKQLTENHLLYTFDQWKTRLYRCVSTNERTNIRILIHKNKGELLHQPCYLIGTSCTHLLMDKRFEPHNDITKRSYKWIN